MLAESGLRHAFFTRESGISKGIYQGLNTGLGSNDERQNILENRTRVTRYFRNDEQTILAGCHQVHSADVITIDANADPSDRPKADALVTKIGGVPLTIQTADCGPILFADDQAGVIGAAHAGWKGATTGVVENTITAMEALGAERQNISAVLGPTISQANYEVGPEFAARLIALDANNEQLLIASEKAEHFMFDLPAFILLKLKQSGVTKNSWTGHCTYADESRFFSYRRTTHRREPDYGRQTSAIMLIQK
ncbi:MAG: peptidoglycan editing factor PgeF [Pseudomonadota bacterium]